MKKTVHIISHSHLDREWYLPYEQHHMRLIELFDDLFELFENDPDFKSFHLDGQTIPLDDFLEVRPEKEAQLRKYIQEGKLKIGPFYILQDDFLISSEANTRNMLVGLDESKKWGEPVNLGYFPDTFGNMGQAPQMMKLAGIDAMAFGRGVKSTGFNNAVIDEEYSTQYSEINWEGSDGTEMFSLLFANWYSNGNEIPTTEKEAVEFWDTKLADAEKFASTDHLLMMNGCDHQPVQMDVTKGITLANKLYPDYEFIHSNFEDYLKDVQEDLPEDIGSVKGELRSQETDGWYTLANTASSHVYIKQKNTDVQNLLERVTEPLATMAYDVTKEYPHDQLRYAWKTLMQNHPHDSICACSADSVHEGMMTRFENAEQVGLFLKDEALRHLQENTDTSMFPEASKPFMVFNTLGSPKTSTVDVQIEWERLLFGGRKPKEVFKELEDRETPNFNVVDVEGNNVDFDLIDEEVSFNYDLPKDQFRVAYMAKYITIRIAIKDMPAFSWDSYALVESKEKVVKNTFEENNVLENDFMKVSILEDGGLTVYDKIEEKEYSDIMHFDDTGDIGNEYIFRQANTDPILTSKDAEFSFKTVEHTDLLHRVELTHTMQIPESADELLDYETRSVVDITERKAERSDALIPFEIKTVLTLERDSKVLDFKSSFDNQAKDHRVRVVFDTQEASDHHFSESIFEVVKRPNGVSDAWENPSNPQPQQGFTALNSLVVGNIGLNEYEVLENQKLAVTLLRSVGELGDWGYFPTPLAQCIGKSTVEYSLAFQHGSDRYSVYKDVKSKHVPFETVQTSVKKGNRLAHDQFILVGGDQALVTALKRKESESDLILRAFNLSNDEAGEFAVSKEAYDVFNTDLIETVLEEKATNSLLAGEIKTVRLKKGE